MPGQYQMTGARAVLDQLMGKHRNLDINDRPKNQSYKDDDICKMFICGFCPHDLFGNTKSDLGPCPLDHDEKMREQFQKASDNEKQPHYRRFVRYCETLIEEADSRVRRANIRMAAPAPMEAVEQLKGADYVANLGKLEQAREQVKTIEAQMAALGEEGKVAESQALLKLTESLNSEIEVLQKQKSEDDARVDRGTNRMRVCEVCGIYTSSNPDDSRAASHLVGKQHSGFQKIRDFVAENRKWLFVRREPEKIAYNKDGDSRRKRSRSPRRDRSRERSRRDRSRDRGRRDRSRDRGRSRRSRSRESDRRRRDRSRDRDRRR